jgi:hypothetical protein
MKKQQTILVLLAALILQIAVPLKAQMQVQNVEKNALKPSAMRFLPVAEIKPGMKGIARTVFSGSVPEEFGVEVLGVLPGFIGPKQPAIIGKLSGANALRTGVFAGMSGSPVFIDGKLIGAISFSFPFSKEPICGITPIESMINIFEQKQTVPNQSREPKSITFAELASTEWKPNLPRPTITASPFMANVAPDSPLIALLGQQFAPIATPLVFSGIRQEALNQFAPQLMAAGLMPVSAVGGASEMTPLKQPDEKTLLPGDSVSMALTRGDFSMAASGTVTFRDGEKVYAFGHPFLNLGNSNLPMSESSVITVIPNTNNSFKLAVPGEMVGSMTQDRATGVFGKLGQAPKMIPVKMNVQTSNNQQETYNFEVVNDSFLTPLLLNITVYNSLLATERALGDATVSVSGQINLKGEQPIKIERRFTGMNAPIQAASSVAIPTSILMASGFSTFEINSITLNVSSNDGKKNAVLERMSISRTEIKAGESVEVQAFVRSVNGNVFVQKIPVKIPTDTPEGTLLVYVGDGSSLQQVAASRSFVPKSVGELVNTINKVKKSDRLYLYLGRVSNGAVIGSNELTNLPPSVLATLNSDRTVGGVTPTLLASVLEQELPPADFIISGQQVLALEVKR